MYPNKPNQNRKPSNSEIKIAQMQYVVGEITKRLQGLIYGFDSYVKMKGDDENLNKYIKQKMLSLKREGRLFVLMGSLEPKLTKAGKPYASGAIDMKKDCYYLKLV